MSSSISRPLTTDIDPFLPAWGLPTSHERLVKRANSTMDEIQAFYDAMMPRLEEIIEYLNQFPIAEIPEADQPLANAALAMCHVDNAVNKWKSPTLESGIDFRRLLEKAHLYDSPRS